MVSRFISHREKDFLRKIFDALDDEKDGELTANEFCDQFKAKFSLELPYKEMRKIIRCIDFADGGDGLIQFTEFVLAGCSKKNLLSSQNVEKEFQFVDMDQDGEISVHDVQKFLQSFSTENSVMWTDQGALHAMIAHIIAEYRPDTQLNHKNLPKEWQAGPRSLSYNHFSAMLNEVNDSIKRSIDGKEIKDGET